MGPSHGGHIGIKSQVNSGVLNTKGPIPFSVVAPLLRAVQQESSPKTPNGTEPRFAPLQVYLLLMAKMAAVPEVNTTVGVFNCRVRVKRQRNGPRHLLCRLLSGAPVSLPPSLPLGLFFSRRQAEEASLAGRLRREKFPLPASTSSEQRAAHTERTPS